MSVEVEPLMMGNGRKTKLSCRVCGKGLRRHSGKNKTGLCQKCHAKEISLVYWRKRKGIR